MVTKNIKKKKKNYSEIIYFSTGIQNFEIIYLSIQNFEIIYFSIQNFEIIYFSIQNFEIIYFSFQNFEIIYLSTYLFKTLLFVIQSRSRQHEPQPVKI